MLNGIEDTSNMTDEQREAHWQAQSDARALAESEVIKNDPGRLKAATDMADKMAEEKIEEARAMTKVATQASTLFDNNSNKEK